MDELKSDLKEIKEILGELVKQGAVHNSLLQEHERRSLALEADQRLMEQRVEPLEGHKRYMEKGLKVMGLIFVGMCIQLFVHILNLS